jgi:hypothetical protein
MELNNYRLLYNYATQNWGHHALAASAEVEQFVVGFLENGAKVSSSTPSQDMMARGFRYHGYSQRSAKANDGEYTLQHILD